MKAASLQLAQLSEVCDVIAGQHIEAALYDSDSSRIPYLTGPADFGDKYPVVSKWTAHPKVFATKDDVLLTVKGAGVGKSNYGCDAAIGRQLMALRAHKGKLAQSYLFAFIRFIEPAINRMAEGATVPGIGKDHVFGIKIPLPSVPEQRRIADILDRADALRAKRRTALARLDELTQAIFVEMFGDPVSNPKGWPTKPFEEVCPTRLGKMLDQKKQSGKHARKYIRNANVQWFCVETSEVYEMDFDQEDRERFRLHKGDLLICEGGEPGRAAIWQSELSECYYQKAVHRGQPNVKLATAEYLVHMFWFLSKGGGLKDHITSATIAHLTSEKLRAIKVPLPPLAKQQQFSDQLAALDRVRVTHQRATSGIDALFASLQDRAFRGAL